MTQKLEEQFREAMISEVYEKALKECGYPATYFMQLVEPMILLTPIPPVYFAVEGIRPASGGGFLSEKPLKWIC